MPIRSDFNKTQKTIQFFLVVVSVLALFLTSWVSISPPGIWVSFAFKNVAIGTSFSLICFFGILAALLPTSCAGALGHKDLAAEKKLPNPHAKNMSGHHVSCEEYASHVLNIRENRFCATCSGLLFGALLAVIGCTVYFFFDVSFGQPFLMVLLGDFGVLIGIIYHLVPKLGYNLIRFLASSFFVLGAFFVLIGVDLAANSIYLDIFVLASSVLWIVTKIALSSREHQQTCAQCLSECPLNEKKVD